MPDPLSRRAPNPLIAVAVLWGLAAAIVLFFLYSEVGFSDAASKFYMVPWTLAAGVVIVAPSIYLVYKGRFDPFHPLVFPAWSYFFPGFVVGGLVLASGLSQPYFLIFIQDEHYNLPLTYAYVMLGFGGLVLGFILPVGRKFGSAIASKLPVWDWKAEQITMPALILLGLGFANTITAFALGIIGYHRAEEIGIFDGTIFLFTLFWLEASFLLWLLIFKAEKLTPLHYIVLGALIFSALIKTAFQGNRGSILQMIMLVGFAFVVSRGRMTLKHAVVGGLIVTVGLLAGMIYGTTFRVVKGTQERASIGEMANVIAATGEKISTQDLSTSLSVGFEALAERIDAVSSLAVVVSNYEALAPYEESFGINNNIVNELTTFFIPRVLWPDKPVAIDTGRYGDLYFNYSENSFTLTPIGDLLRNFGPWGVPLGMILLGLFIRVIYASLVEGQAFAFWRTTLFFMILMSISYEGSYGAIIPYAFKVTCVSMVGILLLRFVIGAGRQEAAEPLARQVARS